MYFRTIVLMVSLMFGVAWGTDTQEQKSNIKFDLKEMISKAEHFTAERYNGDKEMLDYIKDILTDEDFQKDPHEYLHNWYKRRGLTEEYRYPEDRAIQFFYGKF